MACLLRKNSFLFKSFCISIRKDWEWKFSSWTPPGAFQLPNLENFENSCGTNLIEPVENLGKLSRGGAGGGLNKRILKDF